MDAAAEGVLQLFFVLIVHSDAHCKLRVLFSNAASGLDLGDHARVLDLTVAAVGAEARRPQLRVHRRAREAQRLVAHVAGRLPGCLTLKTQGRLHAGPALRLSRSFVEALAFDNLDRLVLLFESRRRLLLRLVVWHISRGVEQGALLRLLLVGVLTREELLLLGTQHEARLLLRSGRARLVIRASHMNNMKMIIKQQELAT